MNSLNSNHDVSTGFTPAAWLHQHDSCVPNVQLRAMTSHSNPKSESKYVTKPFRSLLHIRIDKFGNYGASWNRSIRQHFRSFTLSARLYRTARRIPDIRARRGTPQAEKLCRRRASASPPPPASPPYRTRPP